MIKYMLDTDTVIYVIKRRPIHVLDVFNRRAAQLSISTITLAELYHGAEKSANTDKNMAAVDDFTSRIAIFDYGQDSAGHCGNIRADLERKGIIIGVNDLHIAAHARSHGLTLVTNNVREFERVEGLRVENWI